MSASSRTLPDFLIIGAQRCGTSSLYKYLGAHPQIAPSLRKETEYFSTRFTEGEAWYRSHFPLRIQGKLRSRRSFEATPDYMLDPRAAERAHELVPEARIIAMVRSPTERAYSQYHHNRRHGHEPLSFDDALAAEPDRVEGEYDRLLTDPEYRALPLRRHAYVGRGMYAQQLENWLGTYGADRVLVERFEDLIDSPDRTLSRIERFVGVDDWVPPSFANHSYGMAGRSSSEPMSDNARQHLSKIFETPNRRLEELLGKPMGWSAGAGDRMSE